MAESNHDRWDAALYDSKHFVIWQSGVSLVELLAPRTGERVLDLGCGTGHLTQQIADAGADVVGIDSSPGMIEQSRSNFPGLSFLVADAASFNLPDEFDAVFSNAVLHWIKDPGAALDCVWRALKPGGRFVAEFGAEGNIERVVSAILQALDASGRSVVPSFNPWYFPSLGQYARLAEDHGFRVNYATVFDRPTPLEDGYDGLGDWLGMFAAQLLEDVPPQEFPALVGDIGRRMKADLFREGKWVLDYRRLRSVAVKRG